MSSIDFYINFGGTDSLHSQIAKQIEYYIAVGELVFGDRLPTIRELGRKLGVNHHTVRRAYHDLGERGLLSIRRGSRVTVAIGSPGTSGQQYDEAIYALIDSTLEEAKSLGCTSLQFMKLLRPKALEKDRKNPALAVAECSAAQARDVALALEVALGQSVVGLDISHGRSAVSTLPKSVQFVVTPVFHADEVRDLLRLQETQVIVVHVEIGARFITATRKLLPASSPCMILRDENSMIMLPKVVQRVLGFKRRIKSVLVANESAVKNAVRKSDLVFFTPPCRQVIEDVLPVGKKRQEVTYEFTSDTVALIRKLVGA